MPDLFRHRETALDSPARRAAAVTPDDANDLSDFSRALYIGVAGDLRVTTVGGDTIDLIGVSGFAPVCVARVHATGTTAASATSSTTRAADSISLVPRR